MKIIFTLTQTKKGLSYDIQVSHTQKIKDTLRILSENLPMFANAESLLQVTEADSGRVISTENTYEEARVYSGAEILL